MRRELGLGTFEMAILITGLFLALIGGVAISDQLSEYSLAKRITDKVIHEDVIRPLKLLARDGEFVITVRHEELDEKIREIVDRAAREIENHLVASNLPVEFSVEGRYAVVSIDPVTGESLGLEELPTCVERRGGSQLTTSSCVPLQPFFSRFANTTFSEDSDRSALAVSHARSWVEGASSRYLPNAVMIGLHVRWSNSAHWTAEYRSTLGLENEVVDTRVAVLRGELEL
ncbi:MAG: hypothetical protein KDD60_00435 [Bdellovibrionales bacterium]|nr:hypothetical protein [Bdellovibrionales bacterium]